MKKVLEAFTGVVGFASALALNGMSRFPTECLEVLTPDLSLDGFIGRFIVYRYSRIIPTENLRPLFEGSALLVPSAECALVMYAVDSMHEEEHLYTAIEDYTDAHEDLTELYKVADEYGARDLMEQYISETPKWIEEFYNY